MKKKKHSTTIETKNRRCEKEQERIFAKQFFPPYATKVGAFVNLIYRVHPMTAFRMTAKLLSVACRKKLSTSARAFYDKGMQKHIKVGRATFCTYSYGQGPTILMLHGWCSNAARWRVYVTKLVKLGYKIVVVDAPGHGTASGRFLSVSLYAKGIKSILKSEPKWHAIITHSIAGLTAMAALGNSQKKYHPSKFILMNTFASVETMVAKFSRCLDISEVVIEGTKHWMSTYPEFTLDQFDIPMQYPMLQSESMLIHDTNDVVVPKKEMAYLLRRCKSLHVMKTMGLGHNLRSSTVVNGVVDFVVAKTETTLEQQEQPMAVCV